MKFFLSLFICLMASIPALAQENNCKVKDKNIEGEYKGECKKGLAHGEGVSVGNHVYSGLFVKGLPDGQGKYTWPNGDFYKGEFEKGVKHGNGVFYNKELDSLIIAEWRKGEYRGPQKARFTFKNIPSSPPASQSIQKVDDRFGEILITIDVKNNKPSATSTQQSFGFPCKVEINTSSGEWVQVSAGTKFVIRNATFPLTGTIRYRICNNGSIDGRLGGQEMALDFYLPEYGDYRIVSRHSGFKL